MAGKRIERAEWAHPEAQVDEWKGSIELGAYGTDISVIFHSSDKPGGGPRLHVHPYPETFIITQGRALFTVGDETLVAEAGQIVVAPANVPHKFANIGPGVHAGFHIHQGGRFETKWLE